MSLLEIVIFWDPGVIIIPALVNVFPIISNPEMVTLFAKILIAKPCVAYSTNVDCYQKLGSSYKLVNNIIKINILHTCYSWAGVVQTL